MERDKIKIIYIGTSDFGLPSLERIFNDDEFDLRLIITQPDQPAGRKQELTPPPVKVFCLENFIPCLQPERIDEAMEKLFELSPDVILVIAYGQIIPSSILELPKYGVLNVHGSLLPEYRGAACVQAPILNGDKISGVTIMKMDEGLDTGPILSKHEIRLDDKETFGTLHEKLSSLAAENIIKTIKDYINGSIVPSPQEGESSYVKRIKKADGMINWSKDATVIERFVRAMNPWPGAFAYFDEAGNRMMIKIIEASALPSSLESVAPGMISYENDRMFIICGQGKLEIITIQPEGKRQMTAKDFINGYPKLKGKILE